MTNQVRHQIPANARCVITGAFWADKPGSAAIIHEGPNGVKEGRFDFNYKNANDWPDQHGSAPDERRTNFRYQLAILPVPTSVLCNYEYGELSSRMEPRNGYMFFEEFANRAGNDQTVADFKFRIYIGDNLPFTPTNPPAASGPVNFR